MGPGGAQQQMLRLAESLRAAGASPTVHWYNAHREFHRLPDGVSGGVLPKRSVADPAFWRGLHDALRTSEIVHAWLPYPGCYAGLAGLHLRSAPVVHGVRCAPELFAAHPEQRTATKFAASLARAVTVNARTMGAWLVAQGIAAERVVHLPNQLAPALLDRPAATPEQNRATLVGLRLDPDRPPIVCLGRFDRNKNQIGLLRALGRLRAAAVAAELPPVVLAGDVQDRAVRSAIEPLAAQAHLDVRVLAPVADPVGLLAASRLSVLASLSEGSPNVVLEGLAVGALTVSTRVGEVPNLVHDEVTGWTCPPGDDAGLAACLHRALEMPLQAAQQMGARAQADVRARFGADAIARQYLAFYERVVRLGWSRIGAFAGILRG